VKGGRCEVIKRIEAVRNKNIRKIKKFRRNEE